MTVKSQDIILSVKMLLRQPCTLMEEEEEEESQDII
jgi:hypothetical protein